MNIRLMTPLGSVRQSRKAASVGRARAADASSCFRSEADNRRAPASTSSLWMPRLHDAACSRMRHASSTREDISSRCSAASSGRAPSIRVAPRRPDRSSRSLRVWRRSPTTPAGAGSRPPPAAGSCGFPRAIRRSSSYGSTGPASGWERSANPDDTARSRHRPTTSGWPWRFRMRPAASTSGFSTSAAAWRAV